MDSAASTKNDASTIPKSSSMEPGPLDNLENVKSAIEGSEHEAVADVTNVPPLVSGGYNDIWLINRPIADVERYILRKPKDDALLPDQVRNEVACLTYVREKLPTIPVPRVYGHHFSGGITNNIYIAEEYIEGERLSAAWAAYNEPQKQHIARQIAEIVVTLGETSFDGIGGLMLDASLGPTVEGMKLFKDRKMFHSRTCYDIGPYNSTQQYVLACYDKEIYYYIHAPATSIDWDLFESSSREDFVGELVSERDAIVQDDSAFSPEEPFVLVHGDLHGRNIMVKDGRITGILDWEFAGAYPLSELLGGMGVDVLEPADEAGEEENNLWSERIVALAEQIAREKGWEESRIALLVGDGNPKLQKVRVEMFP
ncbi:MAG: hypothetical protein Q9197_006823 [Variospora fuerteventurae]